MDITHDNVCSSMLSCFYSHLLSTGRPISSFTSHTFLQEDGLADVNDMLFQEKAGAERRLRGVLEELATMCSKYVSHTQGKSGASAGRSKLDKERARLCQREIVCKIQQTMYNWNLSHPQDLLLVMANFHFHLQNYCII